jgi:hypothetical protein
MVDEVQWRGLNDLNRLMDLWLMLWLFGEVSGDLQFHYGVRWV